MKAVSISEYARRRKVSRAAVRKALATGRIPRRSDGLVDPKAANRAWTKNTRPSGIVKGADAAAAASFLRARARSMLAEAGLK